MLFVIMHKVSCIKSQRCLQSHLSQTCKTQHVKLQAAVGVQPGKGLCGISDHCHTHFSPGPCLIWCAGGFPTRNLCRGLLPSWHWQGRHSKQSICKKTAHCDGCEVSPRHMGGGTLLPHLPGSCLNLSNLQSGAKLWKSCETPHPPLLLPCQLGASTQPPLPPFCHLQAEWALSGTAEPAAPWGKRCQGDSWTGRTVSSPGRIQSMVPKPGKRADLVTGSGVSREPSNCQTSPQW